MADREDFPSLGLDYVRFVADRANAGCNTKSRLQAQALFAIFSHQFGNRPADLEAFVSHLGTYNLADPDPDPDPDPKLAVDDFLTRPYPPRDIAQRFNAFAPVQRFLLREIANGAQQFTGRVMRDKLEHALGLGITGAAVRKALLRLPGNTVADSHRGGYVLEDKWMERWLLVQQKV